MQTGKEVLETTTIGEYLSGAAAFGVCLCCCQLYFIDGRITLTGDNLTLMELVEWEIRCHVLGLRIRKHANGLGERAIGPCDQRISATWRAAAIAKGLSTNMNQKVAASSSSSFSLWSPSPDALPPLIPFPCCCSYLVFTSSSPPIYPKLYTEYSCIQWDLVMNSWLLEVDLDR